MRCFWSVLKGINHNHELNLLKLGLMSKKNTTL
jgi:hypothetical protein